MFTVMNTNGKLFSGAAATVEQLTKALLTVNGGSSKLYPVKWKTTTKNESRFGSFSLLHLRISPRGTIRFNNYCCSQLFPTTFPELKGGGGRTHRIYAQIVIFFYCN